MAGANDSAAALALYRRACTTHKRTDWRMACHALAKVAQAAEQAPQAIAAPPAPAPAQKLPRTPSLIQFLARQGVQDPGGELSALDAEHWHKVRPFQRKLIRDDGRSLEHAAEAAWEAGYFPDHVVDWDSDDSTQPVSEGDLIEAIRRELASGSAYDPDDYQRQAPEPDQ